MKTSRASLPLVALMLALIAYGCSEDNPVEYHGAQSPPKPQENFGISMYTWRYNAPPGESRIDYRTGNGFFTIAGETMKLTGGRSVDYGSPGAGSNWTLSIAFRAKNPLGTHEIGKDRRGTARYGIGLGPCWETGSTDFVGNIKINSYDTTNCVIGGTFSFTATIVNPYYIWASAPDTLRVDGGFRTQVSVSQR